MALPVEIDPRAEQEARATFRWYLERSPRTAVLFEQALDRAIAGVAEAPTVGPVVDGDLRRYLLDHFPYALLYSIGPRSVRVIAIAHHHRSPGYWQRR